MSAELALSYLFMFEVGDVCARGFRVGLVADVQDGLDQPFMTIVSSQFSGETKVSHPSWSRSLCNLTHFRVFTMSVRHGSTVKNPL